MQKSNAAIARLRIVLEQKIIVRYIRINPKYGD